MAFDGPSPFDGDPAFDHLDELEGRPPARVRAALIQAFEAVHRTTYLEVDEGVWAWCAAEMVAIALGKPPERLPPEPFASAATRLTDPVALVPSAISALNVVVDDERSEVAQLWAESGQGTLAEHVAGLRARLMSPAG